MKISVWDTYVKREDGHIMHFDILVEDTTIDEKLIISYGKTYLKSKPFNVHQITTEACNFCHTEQAIESVIKDIKNKGFSIIEMEHCN